MAFLRGFLILAILVSACAFAQVNTPVTSQPQTSQPPAPTQNAPQPSASQSASPAAPAPQTQPPAPTPGPPHEGPAPAMPSAPEPTNVPPNAPVITLKGMCSGTAAKPAVAATKTAAGATAPGATKSTAGAADCKTVITRADWERMLAVINRPIPPQYRRQIAEQFVNLFELSNAGAKAGLEKDPKVQERLKLSRIQVLGNAYMEKVRDEPVSESAIDAFYKANAAQFEEVTLKRVYVPKPAPAEGKPVDDAASKALAQKIRDRAAAGEDFEKLQKEAYETVSNKGTPPPTDLGAKRRGSLPPKHEEDVFKLKVGEVSPPYDEQSGFFIYKVEKKGEASLDSVKPEIEKRLQEEKTKEALAKLKDSITPVFNEAYFGPAPSAAGAEPPAGPGRGPAAMGGEKPSAPPAQPPK